MVRLQRHDDGVYYVTVDKGNGSDIRFRRFANNSDTLVYHMTGAAETGIDLSHDGRYLLFTQRESLESDIMILEGIE